MPAIPLVGKGLLPLGIIYYLLADLIRTGRYGETPITFIWICMHLFLSIAPAWIIMRIAGRYIKRKAEQGGGEVRS